MFASCKICRLFAKQKLFGKLFGKPVEKCFAACKLFRLFAIQKLFGKLFSKQFAKQKLFGKLFGKPVGEGWVGSLRYHQLVSTSLGVPDGSNERYGHM